MKLKYIQKIFLIVILVYTIFAAYHFLNFKPYGGDENHFSKELNTVLNEGWISAIKKNISIPYMILAFPFAHFLKDYIALRLISVLLTFLLVVYLYKRVSKNWLFIGILLFYISTVHFFYLGTNDTLFNFGMVVFFVETFRKLNNQNWNGTLAISMLLVAIFTRSLFLIYAPVLFFSFYLLKKENAFKDFNSKMPILVLLLFVFLNLPSLIANKSFSYDNKVPPQGIKSSWTQRQYLAQLMANNNELEEGQHPSWEQTDSYLIKNGKNSLPNGLLSGILFDVKLTFKEFFKDLAYSVFYSFRQIGPILLYLFFSVFIFLFKENKNIKKYFIPLSFLTLLLIFSFIIISNVEIRWMAPLFIMSIVWYWNEEILNRVSIKFQYFNYSVLILFSLFGVIKMVVKFI